MTEKLLFITDTYKDLNLKKDTTILMIEEALKNNFLVYQCELKDLFFVMFSSMGDCVKP